MKDKRPEKIPRMKNNKIQIPCLCCKELFWTTEAKVAIGRKYCSMECVANYRNFGVGKHSKNKIQRNE